jgi:hypothetical protein
VSKQRSGPAHRKDVASSIFVSVNHVDVCLLVPAFSLRRERTSFLLILFTFPLGLQFGCHRVLRICRISR